jgi:drug/metabolite transporter (DMT)-like permease
MPCQVYYSLTPVWAALLANSWLEGEAMGTMAWVGGGIIIAASIAAAISDVGPDGQAQADGGGTAAGQ